MDHHDSKNFHFIKNLVKPGDIFVDVGACHGIYTGFILNNFGSSVNIYTIELMQETFNKLENRFSSFKNVTLINAAVSDKDGVEDLYSCDTPERNNILGKFGSKASEVKSIKLDTLLADQEEISLIKIDVEGAEKKVLDGMKETMKKTKAMLLEVHFIEDWPEIRKVLIEENGFSCYNIETDEIVTMDYDKLPYQCLCRK